MKEHNDNEDWWFLALPEVVMEAACKNNTVMRHFTMYKSIRWSSGVGKNVGICIKTSRVHK